MKRAIIFLIFLISLTFAYGQSPRKVAILPVLDKANSFDGTEGYAKKLMLRMSLHAAISSNEGFIPLDRTDFSAAMNEASFQRSGAVSDDEIRAIGEQYGATHVLIAEIAKVDDERMILSAKITNVQSSASKAALPVIASQDPAKMSEACMDIAASLLDVPKNKASQQMEESSIEDDKEEIFIRVEQMPSFNGGDINTFRNWVMTELRYPTIAQENNISGRVFVKFVVEKDGLLSNIQIIKSPDKSLSKEVVRVLNLSPKWTPGKQRNQTVRVTYNLPIEFQIQN